MVDRRAHAGGAVPTSLSTGITNVATSATLVALIGYPSGSSKWFACIDRGTEFEEKVLVTNVSAGTVTMLRGQDGTSAVAHSADAPFEHVLTALEADEANAHLVATGSEHGLPVGAQFVGTTGAQTLEDKTLDFGVTGGNTATNIPTTASPAIMSAITAVDNDLDAEVTNRAAGDTARYTKVEADAKFVELVGDTMTGALVLPGSPTTALQAAPKQYVDAASPFGSVVAYAGAAAPSGWLLCNGQSVSRTTYAALFAVIGTTYGSVDGSTFNVPNYVGRVLVALDGSDSDFNALTDTGGAKTHTHTAAAHTHSTPAHTHPLSDAGAAKIVLDDANNWTKANLVGGFSSWAADVRTDANGAVITSGVSSTQGTGLQGATDASTAGVTGSDGDDATTATSSLQPYAVVNYIIRAA